MEIDDKMRQVSVPCLYSIVELPMLCKKQTGTSKISAETNRYLLYLTVRKLGPLLAKKLVKKCTYMQLGFACKPSINIVHCQ